MSRLFHTGYIQKFSLQYAFLYVFVDYSDGQRLNHIDYIQKVSLQYVFFGVFGDDCNMHAFTTLITFIGLLSSMYSFII